MRDEECEYRCAKRKVDQITGQPVGHLLNRRARMLRVLDRFHNFPKGRVSAQADSVHVKNAGLIDGARKNFAPGTFSAGIGSPVIAACSTNE